MKIYTWDDPIRFIIKVAFIGGEGSAVKTAFNFATHTNYTIQPSEPFPEGCVMEIPRDLFGDMLKAFAEMANERGMKLESDLKREGRLEATERHLEDMRSLVFKNQQPKK